MSEPTPEGDKSNKGQSYETLQKALENAGKNAERPGTYTVAITVEVQNPSIKEYKVTITPGG